MEPLVVYVLLYPDGTTGVQTNDTVDLELVRQALEEGLRALDGAEQVKVH
jgi:diketogulonate reductase-like aldo/keto reductase